MSFKDIFESVVEYVSDNLPTICASFAATASVGALTLGITSQKKVDEKITDDMTKVEKAGVYLEEQAGTVVVEALAVGAICLARHASQARINELESNVAAAVNLACVAWERARLTEEKTKELVGEEKAKEITDAVANETTPAAHKPGIPISDRDPNIYMFQDPTFDCYFYMTYRDFTTGIYAAEAHFNRHFEITPAEIYYFLGKKAPEGSSDVVIDMDTVVDEYQDSKLPITAAARDTDEGVPYLVISYNTDLKPLTKKGDHGPKLMLDADTGVCPFEE